MEIVRMAQIFKEGSYDELNSIYVKAMKALKLDEISIEAQKDLTKTLFHHFLRNYPDSIWVGILKDQIIGFIISLYRDNHWNIANLSIDPDFGNKGYGKTLFNHVIPENKNLIKTCVIPGASSIAQTLFLKNGYYVQFPIFYLVGMVEKPNGEEYEEKEKSISVYQPDELTPKILENFKEIDKHALGFTRNNEHRYWFDQNRKLYLLQEAGQITAYCYLSESRLGPLVAISDRTQLDIFRYTLNNVKKRTQIIVTTPGINTLIIEELLNKSFKIIGHSFFISNLRSKRQAFKNILLDSISLL